MIKVKKLVYITAVMLCLALILNPVNADSSSKVEIQFTENSDTYNINGKDIKSAKAYTKNGVIMVPLKVITDAFGAVIQADSKDKSILIKYSSTQIKLFVGKKEALVDGKKVSLSQAPLSINGVTMVPLKFIADQLGAEVKTDSKTKKITIIKEIAGDNSIKDFALILKKSPKEKAGDSYHKWSMSLPKGAKITYRSFSGNSNTFEALDKSYILNLFIYAQEDQTLDSIAAEKIEDAEYYTIIQQGMEKLNGQDFFKIVYKDEDGTYEDRTYVNNNKVYELSLTVNDSSKYGSNKELIKAMNSFTTSYANASNTEDLSDVNAGGFRPFEDKKLKVSIDVLASWTQDKSEKKSNEITFRESQSAYGLDADSVKIEVYSIEQDLTLDKWFEKSLKEYKDIFNPDLVKVISTEDITFNNIKTKKILSTTKLKSRTMYSCELFVMGKEYRYYMYYTIKENEYKNTEFRNKIEKMLYSFKFSEPDSSVVGKLIDPDMIKNLDSLKKVSNKDYKWSCQIPSNWTQSKSAQYKNETLYIDNDRLMNFYISAVNDMTLKQAEDYFDNQLKDSTSSGKIKLEKKENIKDKGTDVVKYSISFGNNTEFDTNQYLYMLNKNGYTYMLIFELDELTKAEKNLKVLENVWQSLKFE